MMENWSLLFFFPPSGLRTIRAVCRKHELIQYELELAAQDLAYKKQQKEELVTGVKRP